MAKKTSKTTVPAADDGQDPNELDGQQQPGADEGGGQADEPSIDDKALEAFSAGVDGTEPAPAPAPKGDDTPPAKDPKPDEKPDEDGDDEDGDDKGAGAQPDAEVEKEIASLGIKNTAAQERFRALTSIAKERDQMAEQLAELTGLGDERDMGKIIESVTAIRDQALEGYEFQQAIQKSGVQPEQFGALMGYAQLANSGDPEKMKTALTAIRAEYEDLARRMGEPVDGVYDPLEDHQDLLAKVNSGKLDREDALETARLRNATKQANARAQQVETQQNQVSQATQAQQAGFNQVREMCAGYATKEPELYKELQPGLSAQVKDIQANHAPEQWAAQTELAYLRLKAERLQSAPPQQQRRAPPARPGGAQVGSRVPRDDFDALELGIQSATVS